MFSALLAVCVGRSGFARDILRQCPVVASWEKSETLCPSARLVLHRPIAAELGTFLLLLASPGCPVL